MSQTILTIKNMSKTYGKAKVVDNFSLEVKKGHICGLIGPNGAGKTTIMKMMAGLTLPDNGEMSLWGDSTNLDKNRKRMSFMIESPIIDPEMTARQNLTYLRYVRGVADKNKIDEVLEFTGLSDTGKKKAKHFSLGMKQRLGIAMSLLTDPEIMVLDEPVNGLDPEGIVEVRHMLQKLSDERNVTIIISSHLLSELSELCTDYTIINHGKLIVSLSAEELSEQCKSYICVRTDNMEKTTAILEEKLSLKDYKVFHDEELHIFEKLDKVALISKTITDNGIVITRLCEEHASLEEFYLSKVGDDNE
ncbi:MAG: ATP-binding cassette domain-containing protein [Oscillospiraceae bacterium]|nr:ATP-binding cassette domain-containing protein [Oscillospiraceae bacterium]